MLIGLAGVGRLFTADVLRAVAAGCPKVPPIIMPMSNPTSKAECTCAPSACGLCALAAIMCEQHGHGAAGERKRNAARWRRVDALFLPTPCSAPFLALDVLC